jgi:hypothetical protein
LVVLQEKTIDLVDHRGGERRVWIEPWCSEHTLAPGQRLRIVIQHDAEPTYEVEETEDTTIVWLHHHTWAYFIDHGKRLFILDSFCQTPASPD